MTETYNDAASRLWWGARRYAWIFLAIVPLTTIIAFVAARGAAPLQRTYRASALVIATERQFTPDLFARLSDAVFTGGTVAERAVSEGRLPIDPQDLIPTYASLEPVQDNIIIKVIGKNRNPELAARIANAAATALVEELNRPGRGVGVFAVQDHARVPVSPDSSTSRALPLVVGVLAGFLLGGGIIGLILTIRRPILGPGEATDLVGAPLLGTPKLPGLRAGRPVDPQDVKGLAALAKRIMPTRPGIVALAACGGDERVRSLIAQLLAGVLGERGAVFLIPSHEASVEPMYEGFAPPNNVVVADRLPDGKVWRLAAVIIDGPSAKQVDVPQVLPNHASTVLVVMQGTALDLVRDAAEQFLPGELEGIVFVRRSEVWPWFRSPSAVHSGEARPHSSVDAWAETQQPSPAPGGHVPSGEMPAAQIRLADQEIALERERPVSRAEVRAD